MSERELVVKGGCEAVLELVVAINLVKIILVIIDAYGILDVHKLCTRNTAPG